MLTTVVNNKLGRIGIGFKTELFGDEPQLYVWLVPAYPR